MHSYPHRDAVANQSPNGSGTKTRAKHPDLIRDRGALRGSTAWPRFVPYPGWQYKYGAEGPARYRMCPKALLDIERYEVS
jgi:hypothetical protein